MYAVLTFLALALVAGSRPVGTDKPISRGFLFAAACMFALAMTSRRVI